MKKMKSLLKLYSNKILLFFVIFYSLSACHYPEPILTKPTTITSHRDVINQRMLDALNKDLKNIVVTLNSIQIDAHDERESAYKNSKLGAAGAFITGTGAGGLGVAGVKVGSGVSGGISFIIGLSTILLVNETETASNNEKNYQQKYGEIINSMNKFTLVLATGTDAEILTEYATLKATINNFYQVTPGLIEPSLFVEQELMTQGILKSN